MAITLDGNNGITTPQILNAGANGSGNIGSANSYFGTLFVTTTSLTTNITTTGNVLSDGRISAAGNISTASTISATGNISTASSMSVGGSVAVTGALSTGSLTTANVSITGGTITGITDLAVADGGTGSSSLAANNVLLGNGTSPLQTVAPGSSGNVLGSNGTTWSSTTPASILPGMGYGGSVWNNVTGSRAFNTTYTNSRSYPIMVSASTNFMGGSQQLLGYVNGALVCFWKWQFNGAGAVGGVMMPVPPGATYSCNTDGGVAVQNWTELY